MKDVRITVKKIVKHTDLIKEYENPITATCNMRENMVFVSKDAQKPQDFCEQAWESVYPFVLALSTGGQDFFDGWMKNKKSAMISCNDGFRPVSFLLETIE